MVRKLKIKENYGKDIVTTLKTNEIISGSNYYGDTDKYRFSIHVNTIYMQEGKDTYVIEISGKGTNKNTGEETEFSVNCYDRDDLVDFVQQFPDSIYSLF